MAFQELGVLGGILRTGRLLSAEQIRGGTINAQEIILSGGTQGVLRSQNFDPTGPTGWAIFGDGSATFGGAVTLGADLKSANWDGVANPDLTSSADLTATEGYFIDYASGNAQFEGTLYVHAISESLTDAGIDVSAHDLRNINQLRSDVGPDASDFWFIWGDWNGGDTMAIGQWDDSASTSLQRIGIEGKGTGVTDAGDIFLTDQDANVVWRWDQSADQFTILKREKFENSFGNPGGSIVGYDVSGREIIIIEGGDGVLTDARIQVYGNADTSNPGKVDMYANTFRLYGSTTSTTAAFLNQAGTAAAPSYSFTADTNTGIYWHEADRLGITTGGTLSLLVDAGGMFTADGTKALPAFTFLNDPDTGMFRADTNDLGLVAGGTHGLRIEPSWVRPLDGTTGNFLIKSNGAGSAASPTYAFLGDADTGMYRAGTNSIGFAVQGVIRASIDNGGTAGRFFGPGHTTGSCIIRGEANSASTPTYTFYGDENTGMYRQSADAISFATAGTRRLGVDVNGLYLTMDGSLSTPAIRINDGNTGIYITASHTVVLDSDGVAVVGAAGTDGSLYINRYLDDIGNHETLRADRVTSNGLTEVGYYSSWAVDPDTGKRRKKNITRISNPTWWKREWFLDLEPVKYERVRRTKSKKWRDDPELHSPNLGEKKQIEFGFTIENLIEHTNLLTTSGDEVGGSPDEYALLAVTVDYVQYLEERVAALEEKVAALS